MKNFSEIYSYGELTATAEAVVEKYGTKPSLNLNKFTNNLCSQLVPLVIKAIDCAKVNNDDEAFCEIILCFQALNRRTPFKKRLTNEEKARLRKDISTQNKSQTRETSLFLLNLG